MTVRPFVDTNVLVYAHDEDEPAKRAIVLAWLESHAGRFTISAQVLAEFYVTVTRKLSRPLHADAAARQIEELSVAPVISVDRELGSSAARFSHSHQVSLWDAMILGAAVRGGCDTLVTEDLADGAVLDGVRILEPFASGAAGTSSSPTSVRPTETKLGSLALPS